MKRIDNLVLTFLLVAAACALGESFADSPATVAVKRNYPYRVETTVGMVTDIVRNVAGDKARVSGIIGEAVDPHLYKSTRDDVARMLAADVVFYSGLSLEGKMGDVLLKVARTKPVYAVTELIDEKFLLEPAGFSGHYDPHVWMDPTAWSKAVQAVASALAQYDPTHKDFYQSNADLYIQQLLELDRYAKQAFATVDKKQRVLITSHDAFNYFGRAYDVTVKGIQGISTESEAGLKDIRLLIDYIVAQDVKAVFVESSVPRKNVMALIEGCKARKHPIKIGGMLFSDAFGAAGDYEGTYIGMIDHNVTTVVRALGGKAPETGFKGRLNVKKYGGE